MNFEHLSWRRVCFVMGVIALASVAVFAQANKQTNSSKVTVTLVRWPYT